MQNNEIKAQQPQQYQTAIVKINQTYLGMITDQFAKNNVQFSEYGKVCVMNAIGIIDNLLKTNGMDWSSSNLDTSTFTRVLQKVAIYEINPEASNREVYFQLRNVAFGDKNNPTWKKVIEIGIEGDGNEKIVSRFGKDVKKVYPVWLVRENDDFTYPKHVGLKVEDPTWTPKGKGKVVRVVYPIQYSDGHIEYHIAERDDVVKNFYAHVSNNMMNETFGLCPDRFKANAEQKEAIAKKKKELLAIIDEKGLDAIDDPKLEKWISPSWSSTSGKESMIIRKMKNNVLKPIPKDFGSPFLNDVVETQRNYIDAEYVEHSPEEINHKQINQIEEAKIINDNKADVAPNDTKSENPNLEQKQPQKEAKVENPTNLFDRFN